MDGIPTIHLILPYIGLIGLLFTAWRWHKAQTRAAQGDRDALVVWRSNVEHRLDNCEAYAKRIEQEYKAQDAKQEQVFTKIINKLGEISDRLTRIEARVDSLVKRNGHS